MENLCRVRVLDEDDGKPLPFKDLHPQVAHMRVKEGSKIRNLVGYALPYMRSEDTRQIVFSAYGRAVTKAITCVEILKRQLGGLYQITKLQYKSLQEVWEPKGPEIKNPTPSLTVYKNCPSIYILLSKEPLNPQENGYQGPQSFPTREHRKRTHDSLDLPISDKACENTEKKKDHDDLHGMYLNSIISGGKHGVDRL